MEGVSERKYTVAYWEREKVLGTFYSILVDAYYHQQLLLKNYYTLQLCQELTGMILSLSLI